ncbi:uncharacterized protein LOC116352033 [Contarinia nasturtii]|uniref:uncharacterized protein LOC116352033 n=1 Tax=Contarinia nasturtii TaxID=265458 RepID=UPI0012D40233|nr:uncharacterized protein LOC116352033 [Contarinia nasturtii]
MRIFVGVGVCLLLHLSMLYNVNAQTNNIEIGDFRPMVIYNTTKEYPTPKRPWYKVIFDFFTRSQKPVLNFNETFPSNKSIDSDLWLAGIRVMDADRFGKGGLVKIVDGGLHQTYVTINFCSKPGESMLYTIILNAVYMRNNSYQQNAIQKAAPTNPSPSYGWIQPTNISTFNRSSVLVQNLTSPSNSPWWHFW